MSTFLIYSVGGGMLMGYSEDGADYAAHERRGAGLRDGQDEGAGAECVLAVSNGGGHRIQMREREHWTGTGNGEETMTMGDEKRRDFRVGGV